MDTAWPEDVKPVNPIIGSEPKMHPLVAGTAIANARGCVVVLDSPRAGDLDSSANSVSVALASDKMNEKPVMAVLGAIDPYLGAGIEAVDNYVDVAVIIDVSKRRATMSRRNPEILAGKGGYIGKRSVPIIPKDAVCHLIGEVVDNLRVVQNSRVRSENILPSVVIEVVNAGSPEQSTARLRINLGLHRANIEEPATGVFVKLEVIVRAWR